VFYAKKNFPTKVTKDLNDLILRDSFLKELFLFGIKNVTFHSFEISFILREIVFG
jgi:hypothetical protein